MYHVSTIVSTSHRRSMGLGLILRPKATEPLSKSGKADSAPLTTSTELHLIRGRKPHAYYRVG